MMNFFPIEFSINLYIFINIFYIIVVAFYWHDNVTEFGSPHKGQPFLWFLVLFHLIFAYDGGDTYHYAYNLAYKEMDGMEPIYNVIASLVNYNYFLFRVIVWGSGLFLFVQTVKRFGLDPNKTVFVLYVMFITIYDYARASLAMSIYFYGVSFLCVPIKSRKLVSYIVGCLIIAISIVFHRSMLFPTLITAFVFLPMNKYSLYSLIIIFTLSSSLLNNFTGFILGNLIMADQETIEKVENVSNLDFDQAAEGKSFYEHVRQIVLYATFLVPLILLSYKMFSPLQNKKIAHIQKKYKLTVGVAHFQKLYKLTIGIVLMAFLVLLIRIGNFIVFIRFFYMAMIPVVILLVYGRQRLFISDRIFKALLIIGILLRFYGVFKLILGGNFS